MYLSSFSLPNQTNITKLSGKSIRAQDQDVLQGRMKSNRHRGTSRSINSLPECPSKGLHKIPNFYATFSKMKEKSLSYIHYFISLLN